jgi:CRISPR-associated protein Csc1
MDKPIRLNEIGIRLYAVRLYNHDYLWFSSFEISKTAGTAPAIHNYALSYAISNYSYGIFFTGGPKYEEDLASMPAFATPARPVGKPASTRFTQNAINSLTLRTDDAPRGINSPALGYRLVLDPVWRVVDGERDPSGFSFYVFAKAGYLLPSVVRLGKKGCPVRMDFNEIKDPIAVRTQTVVQPTHAVNPLDVQGDIKAYQPIPMPPHLILKVADIQNDWFVFSGSHVVHVPSRFTGAELATPASVAAESAPRTRRKAARK